MSDYQGPSSLRPEEHSELIALLNQTFREDGGCMLADYPRHLGLNNQANIRVMKKDGAIVAHVATTVRPVLLGGIPTVAAGIGAVATHADHRGNRLASILMEDAVSRSVEQGADIMLISGDEGVYKRMNAVFCGRFPKIVVEKKDISGHCNAVVKPVAQEDIGQVNRIRAAMPTRYVLPKEDLIELLKCGKVMDKPADWWLIGLEGEFEGFAATRCVDGAVHAVDWAGHPAALKRAAVFWMDHYQAERFVLATTIDAALPVGWRGLIEKEELFYGTALVINAARFLERARPYIEEKVGEDVWRRIQVQAENQQVKFSLDGQSASFDNGGELSLLFFGEPGRNFIAEKSSPDSALCNVLSSIFPIPLVWYGVGYV